jgi:hypothetical protein
VNSSAPACHSLGARRPSLLWSSARKRASVQSSS